MDFEDELEFMTLKEGILLLEEDSQFIDKRVSLVSEAGCVILYYSHIKNKSFETANFLSVVGCILNQMENNQLLFELVVSNNHSLKFQCKSREEKQEWLKQLSVYTTSPKNKSRGISLPDVKVEHHSPVHHRNFNQSAPSLVSTTSVVHDYNDDDQRDNGIQNLSSNSYDEEEEEEEENQEDDETSESEESESIEEEFEQETPIEEDDEEDDEDYYDYEKEKEKQLKSGNRSSATVGTIKLTSSSNNIQTPASASTTTISNNNNNKSSLRSYQFTEDESFIIELFPNVEVSVILDALEFCRGDRDEVIALLASQTRLSFQGDLNLFSPIDKKIKQQQSLQQKSKEEDLEQKKLKKELKKELKQLELEEEQIDKQNNQQQQQQQQVEIVKTRPRHGFKVSETYQKPDFINCNITLRKDDTANINTSSYDSSEHGSLEDEVSFNNHYNQQQQNHHRHHHNTQVSIEPSFVALNISNVSIVDNSNDNSYKLCNINNNCTVHPPTSTQSPSTNKSFSTSSLPSTSLNNNVNNNNNNKKNNWSYKPSTSNNSTTSTLSTPSSLSSSQDRSLSSSQDHSLSSSQDRQNVNNSYYGNNSPKSTSSPNSLRSSQERPNTPTNSWKPFTKSGAAWDLSIKINGFFQLDDHIEYRIHVVSNSNEWFVFRRYNNFLLLDKKLKNLGIIDKKDIGLTLPPKKLKVASNQVAKARQNPLESYLVYLLSNYQGIFYNNNIVNAFLNSDLNSTIIQQYINKA